MNRNDKQWRHFQEEVEEKAREFFKLSVEEQRGAAQTAYEEIHDIAMLAHKVLTAEDDKEVAV